MREIKFRVWDEAERIMYEFDFREYMNSIGSRQDELCPTLSLDHVMQYTGLNDRNGKKIYEGDIVKDEHGIGEVEWVQEHCSYLIFSRNPSIYHHIESDGVLKFTEVIGNIYEHPHLLERRESE